MESNQPLTLFDIAWYRGCRFLGSTSFLATGPLMALLGAIGGRPYTGVNLAPDGQLIAFDKSTGVDYVVTPH